MKTLILINEDFHEMILGQNTTLAYILAAVDLRHDVYIHKIAAEGFFSGEEVAAINLNFEKNSDLVQKYKELNSLALTDSRKISVRDFCQINFAESKIKITDVEYIIQRLEPMKLPFPPLGEIDIKEYLQKLQDIFPDKKFNNPSNCYDDKELPLVLSEDYKNLATPTIIAELFVDDFFAASGAEDVMRKNSSITKNNFPTIKNLCEVFQTNKIVIKPQNSAQGFGVFAIEFVQDSDDLQKIQEQGFLPQQSFKIKDKLAQDEFRKIVEILCFWQFLKTQNNNSNICLKNFAPEAIKNGAISLYGKKILIQPFLVGVVLGDVRINLAKNKSDNFVVVGSVFRKNINQNNGDFITGITSGHARAVRVEDVIAIDEEKNLISKINFVLDKLNNDLALKTKYKNCLELGCDFLLKGDKKEVFLGEVNHYCPALVPFSEVLEWQAKNLSFYQKINGIRVSYDGGLGVVKEIIA